MQRDGCSHKYRHENNSSVQRTASKQGMARTRAIGKYQVSKGYTLMGLVCLARTPRLILKNTDI